MDSVYLVGHEQVQRAASQMSQAAHDMMRAANEMAAVVERQQRAMDDWLQRFEEALSKAGAAEGGA